MRWSLLVVSLAFTSVAHAQETYEGRRLPEGLKRILWDKACDVVPKQSVDCAKERCIFKDSKGESFNPDMQPWQNVLMYEWSAGGNVLQPSVVESKIAGPDEGSDPRVAMGLLSGLVVDLDPNDYMVQLNPLLVRWVGRELVPPADTPMCGATARDIYERGFKGPIRQAIDVYAQLKAKGQVKGVKTVELAKNFETRRGRFASTCQAVAKKSPDAERWSREALCWWWLRRVATGGADELAQLFGQVLAEYDADALKTWGSVIPKVVAAKPVTVVPKAPPKHVNPF